MILPVLAGHHTYDVVIEEGALARIGDYLPKKGKALVVTDDGVPTKYADAVAAALPAPVRVTVAQGEGSKSMRTLERLLTAMLRADFTRNDAVVAVGGGVVGDLAGLAASLYMRGIAFYNLPTTLLSQIDSSIGGKTAVNLCGIKNCVGAFAPPRQVVIDPEVLATLPKRQWAAGMAEAVKMAAILDAEFFGELEKGNFDPSFVIPRALALKKAVVEEDEGEKNLRRILNFGHTLGHGIEAEGGLSRYLHGEAVALGMLPLAEGEARERIRALLSRLELPTETDLSAEAVLSHVAHDKKAEGGDVIYVSVPQIGAYRLCRTPLEEFCALAKENWF